MTQLHVIYEDNHLLVVNKAAGMLAQGDKTGDPSLVDQAKTYIKHKYKKPGAVFLGLVHRLDRPTTGALVLARTSKALTRLNAQFKNREPKKVYWAIVSGSPEQNAKLVHFLKKNSAQNKSYPQLKESKEAKKAILEYTFLKKLDSYSLLEIRLKTGRHHQIRAQLAAAKLHIKGDVKYGAKRANKNGGIHLHARSLSISHPTNKEIITFLAPLPDDKIWKACLSN